MKGSSTSRLEWYGFSNRSRNSFCEAKGDLFCSWLATLTTKSRQLFWALSAARVRAARVGGGGREVQRALLQRTQCLLATMVYVYWRTYESPDEAHDLSVRHDCFRIGTASKVKSYSLSQARSPLRLEVSPSLTY